VSGEMVPQGLPYGERDDQAEAMRSAGLRTDLGSAPARPTIAGPSGSSSPAGADPLDGDPLLSLDPSAGDMGIPMQRPPSFKEQMRTVASTSPNPLARSLASRFLQGEES
jgi:hypothetical protein